VHYQTPLSYVPAHLRPRSPPPVFPPPLSLSDRWVPLSAFLLTVFLLHPYLTRVAHVRGRTGRPREHASRAAARPSPGHMRFTPGKSPSCPCATPGTLAAGRQMAATHPGARTPRITTARHILVSLRALAACFKAPKAPHPSPPLRSPPSLAVAPSWGNFPLPVHLCSRGVEERGARGEELEPSRRGRVARSATVPAGMPGAVAPKTTSRSYCRLFKRRPSTLLKPCTPTHSRKSPWPLRRRTRKIEADATGGIEDVVLHLEHHGPVGRRGHPHHSQHRHRGARATERRVHRRDADVAAKTSMPSTRPGAPC
jgi:hypothetical protein